MCIQLLQTSLSVHGHFQLLNIENTSQIGLLNPTEYWIGALPSFATFYLLSNLLSISYRGQDLRIEDREVAPVPVI